MSEYMLNPFSTRYWASGTVSFRFSEKGETVTELLERAQQYPICQIVGPHGSGKSTLLLSLLKEYEKMGEYVRYLCFNDQQKRIPNDISFSENTVLLVDGIEHLPYRDRFKLPLITRPFRTKSLIFTVHQPIWLVPVLYRTQPQFSIFVQLVRQIAYEVPEESALRRVFDRSGGNFRTAFFELYDHWEKRSDYCWHSQSTGFRLVSK